MATKITDMPQYTNPVSTDVLPVVDVAADITKKISIAALLKNAAAGTASEPSIAFDGDNAGLYLAGPDKIAVATNSASRLVIDGDGYVGLGTENPSGLLHVASSGAVNTYFTSSDSTDVNLYFGDTSAETSGRISYINSSSANAFTFYTSGVERLRLASDGKFGVNTSTPDALLTVNGVATFGAGAVGTPSIAATGDLDTGVWFPSANTIAVSTDGSERLRINSSGNISASGNLNLASGKTYSIDGTEVLSATALGSAVQISSANIPAGTIVDSDINASAEIAVSKLADGAARQLLQTDAAGTEVEWASNIDIPGTLDVTSTATFDSTVAIGAGNLNYSDGTY